MMRRPKINVQTPALPPPPPPPKPIPTETDPSVIQARVAASRKARQRRGRAFTLLSGALGDGIYGAAGRAAEKKTKTLLGG